MERTLTRTSARPLPGPGVVWKLLRQWHQTTRTRHQLAELTSQQLADIGVSPSERVREISKPFWR